MSSILPNYEYDVFISYRHKDNKGDRWVSRFADALRTELDSTFKEEISVYLDTNSNDGLSDHHDVDLSLKEKVKALIFIPIISQTYCDSACFAWKNEFLPFRDFASRDEFGLKVKVANGNVANRILPIRIHELEPTDLKLLETELGGVLRAIDFTFKSDGVNRPLRSSDRDGKIIYGDQINKVANAIKEIVDALKTGSRPLPSTPDLFPSAGAIPTPATTLFGRSKELDELAGLLRTHRLVSIVGTGGIGKTRLALELARRARQDFSGNVGVAFLAALKASDEVIPAVASLLGVKEAEGRDLTKGIASVIGDRKALLVLDNMEQVTDVAPQIAELILNCANLTILTTTRTPLKITAEHEYTLKPLPLPGKNPEPVEQVMKYPSISLFVDRAKKVKGGFTLSQENASDVVRICQRLDGLPLALELAAARVRMMSTGQLLQRLEHTLDILTSGPKDLPERHQTLRATINWSHSLLNDPEKRLFRRMSVFAGGCTLDAIEQTCYEGNSAFALNELESLVDKGLVQPSTTSDRFIMLETIREFATEEINSAGEMNEIRFRHAKYFQKVARRVRFGLECKDQLDAMRLGIDEELNIQSALDFLLTEAKNGKQEATEMGLMICGHLCFFWHIWCQHIKARHYSNSFLTLPNCPDGGEAKCWCLTSLAIASFTLGRHEQSIIEYQAAYDIAPADDLRAKSFARLGMFLSYIALGRIEEASEQQKQNMLVSVELNDEFYLAFAHDCKGILHLVKGELDDAVSSYSKAVELQQRIPDLEGGGVSLGGLALIASIRGNYETSIDLYRSTLNSFLTIGDPAEEARILEEMAWVFLKMKNASEARAYFLRSIRAYEGIGSVRGMGLALMGIAGVESVSGNPAKAIRIATAAQLFTEQEGIVNSYGEGFQGKVYLDNARTNLSSDELAKEIASGRNLSLKETLQLATA